MFEKVFFIALKGNVFSLDRKDSNDPFLGSHLTDVVLDPIVWKNLEERNIDIENSAFSIAFNSVYAFIVIIIISFYT